MNDINMRILIITFTKGINPGTFMQAYSVQSGMLSIFPNAEIDFLNFKDYKVNKVTKLSNRSMRTLFFQKFFALLRLLNYRSSISKAFRLTKNEIDLFDFKFSSIQSQLEQYDLLVIGSDTILEQITDSNGNVGLNWCSSKIDIKKVYFAASASPARFDLSQDLINELKRNVSVFSFIGLRDNLSVSLFTDRIGVDSQFVIKQPDPTYCIDVKNFTLPSYYRRKLVGKKIALYNFNVNFPFRKELATILKEQGYVLVSTFYNPFVDIQIATVDAFGWAAVFQYCELIVTERFHDTVFALRNYKPVIAIDWDKERFSITGDSKTFGILSDYELTDYHFNISDIGDLDKIKTLSSDLSNFDYEKVDRFNEKYCALATELLTNIASI